MAATPTSETEPLAGFELFRTRDPLVAQESATRVTAPHRLRVYGQEVDFAAAFDAVEVGPATLGVIRYGTDVTIERPRFDGFLAVLVPLCGHLAVEQHGREHVAEPERSMVVLSPGHDDSRVRWARGTTVLALKVESADLNQARRWVAPQADERPFEASSPVVTGPAWRSVLGTAQLFTDVFSRIGPRKAVPLPLVRRLREQAITTLWLSVPNNHTDIIHQIQEVPRSAHVRQAIDLLAAEPRAEYTVPDLARAVHVGVRALEMAFRRDLDQTPLQYMHRIRLERAHDDLRDLDPSETTVTEVALRWGFPHLGRFAARYRAQYGEIPSETLKSPASNHSETA